MAPPPSSFLSPNFPILAVIISGILTTFFILVSFYFFVTRCHLRDNTSVQNAAAPVVPFFPLRSQGLKPSLIRSIPIVKFSKSRVGTVICMICLNEYCVEERLRLLPSCSHVFHIDCIDTWLQSNANCPLCRVSVANDPTSLDHDRRRQHHDVTLDCQRGFEDELGNVMITRRSEAWKKADKRSLGDDCIVHVRENNEDDELFRVQPIRRSLSLDSSSERQVVYLSVQEMLQKKQKHPSSSEEEEVEEDGGECSSRSVQPCFAFGQGRSWQKPVHAVG